MLFSHTFFVLLRLSTREQHRGFVLFKQNFVLTEFVLCGESFYRSSAGTTNRCSFYAEFRTKRVRINDIPLYVRITHWLVIRHISKCISLIGVYHFQIAVINTRC